ncbi:hypothetical protein R1sor_006901 [Riccia sorocarpa]|uniref:NAD(P)H dehydrogenase (quinone) n=1 Tax=Riccia sorocarpa TaxID=122646 RepID=A0ABD3HSK1_9MARC
MAIRVVLAAGARSVAAARPSVELISGQRSFRSLASSLSPALGLGSSAGLALSDSWTPKRRNTIQNSRGGRKKVDTWGETVSVNSSGWQIVKVNAMSSSAPSESNPLKILGISGSLRTGSSHRGLLRAAAEIVNKEFPDVSFEIVDISNLPFVNTDLEVNGTYPESVTEFRAKVLAADGFLFACPEYNYSVPGVLKNALDWASRPPNVWADKGAAVVSTGGGAGGARSSYHLRQTAVYIDLHFINKPEMFVKLFEPPQKFDQDGNLIDKTAEKILREVPWKLNCKDHAIKWKFEIRTGSIAAL